MTKKIRAKIKKLKPGDLVEVRWLDSGREDSSSHTELAERDVYGRVKEIRTSGYPTLVLAMDVCVGDDEHVDGGNKWGFIWLSAIVSVTKLKRKK